MFEDVFGPLDDVLEDTPRTKDEWDTGETWDSGEKENIWRAEPAATPGVVWNTGSGGCGDGCQSCDDDCETDCDDDCVDDCAIEDHGIEEVPPSQQTTAAPAPSTVPEDSGLSESEQLDEFDEELEMSEEDEDESGSPSGVFDDIFFK